MLRFQCSPDVSLQDVGSGGISEPQTGLAVAAGYISLPGVLSFRRFSVLQRRLAPGARLCLYFRAPERPRSRSWNHACCPLCSVFAAPQTSPSRMSALVLFPSPERPRSRICERGRLSPICRLWRYFRAPERASSSRWNHGPSTYCFDFSVPQTSPSRMSAPAVFPSPREGQQ